MSPRTYVEMMERAPEPRDIPIVPVEGAPTARGARIRRVARRVAAVTIYVLAGYYLLALLLLVVFRFASPPVTGVRLERRLEALFSEGDYRERRTVVSLAALPRHVPRAIVAAEDGRFWTHWGYDLVEMGRAGKEMLQGERTRGASTITQQLVKNLFGCTCRNPIRKLYDLALALPAQVILGRERVLELYLNNVEWGDGIFGIEAAAQHHYGRSAKSLTRSQAAGLAALLPNPLRRTPENTGEYRAAILRRMDHRGW
jgi:monofunctional glycosyltransferase